MSSQGMRATVTMISTPISPARHLGCGTESQALLETFRWEPGSSSEFCFAWAGEPESSRCGTAETRCGGQAAREISCPYLQFGNRGRSKAESRLERGSFIA